MADTTYVVRTVYETETDAAEGATDRLAAKHTLFANSLASSAGMLSGMFDRVAGAVTHAGMAIIGGGVAAGIAALVSGVTQLNAGAETSQIALAGMFQAGGAVDDFNGALRLSESTIQRMRVHARELPGEFQDLMNVFQGGLLGGLAAGKTSQQIEALSAQFMAVSQTFHIDSQTAGRELGMMLEGRAGAHVAMFARMHSLIGKTAQEFNHMTEAARFDAINRALSGFGPAIERYGHSWDAISSTAKDHLHDMMRVGTAPLFEHVKNTLQRVNEWFESNETHIMAMVQMVGGRLADAFDRVVNTVTRLGSALVHLNLHSVIGSAEHGIGSALAARAGLGLLSSTSVMSGVGGLVGGGALAGGGIIAAIALPIATAIATGAVDIHATTGRLSRAMEPLGPALRDLWVAVQPLLATVGVALVEVFTSLIEAITPVVTTLVQFGTGLASAVAWIAAHFPGTASGNVRPEGMGETEADARGMALDSSSAFGTLANIQRTHNMEMDALREGDLTAFDILRGGMRMSVNEGNLAMSDAINDFRRDTITGRLMAHGVNEGAEHRAATAGHNTPSGHMTVHVRIEQTINDASDPDRVLIQTRRALNEAFRHPIESHSIVHLQ